MEPQEQQNAAHTIYILTLDSLTGLHLKGMNPSVQWILCILYFFFVASDVQNTVHQDAEYGSTGDTGNLHSKDRYVAAKCILAANADYHNDSDHCNIPGAEQIDLFPP